MQSRGSISFTVPPLTLERGMPLTDGGQACEVPRGQVVDISRSKEDEQGRGKGGTNKKRRERDVETTQNGNWPGQVFSGMGESVIRQMMGVMKTSSEDSAQSQHEQR